MDNPIHCYLSSSCFPGQAMEDVLKICEAEGIHRVEWSAPHPLKSVEEIQHLLKAYQEKGFSFLPHNYFPPQGEDFVLNIASLNQHVRDLSIGLVNDMLDIAKVVSMPVYGIHAGYFADPVVQADGMFGFPQETIKPEKALRKTVEFVEHVLPLFKEVGVKLIVENLFPLGNGEFSLNCSYEEIKDVMAAVGPEVGLLLDLGHLNVTSELRGIARNKFIDKYLTEFGPRIYEVHLSENNGREDQHLPVLEGSWQLDIIKELETIKMNDTQNRLYCLEARNSEGIKVLKESLALISNYIPQKLEIL